MTSEAAYSLFDTAIGRCGIAWGACGVLAVQLPEARDAATRARLLRRLPGAVETSPSAQVGAAAAQIGALLCREPNDLSVIVLDMRQVPDFEHRVYEVARTIPPGATATYGELARRLGDAAAAREVGQALGRNPFAIVVPCHRVLAVGGRPGGFSANGGIATKLRILAIEGARTDDAPMLFDELPLAARPRRRQRA